MGESDPRQKVSHLLADVWKESVAASTVSVLPGSLNFNFATSPPFRFIFRSGAINARHAIVEINFDQALPRGTES
jgi:hypothetical protein